MKTNRIRFITLMKASRIMLVAGIALMSLLIMSCNKSKDKAHLSVSMTDAPALYNNVMIDLQRVEVTGSGGGTVVLNTQAGLYNLLDFTNGLSTLIATGDLDAGTVSQIRLILGPNSTVMVDSNVYPLSTPSAMQSGLKLQIHREFEPGVSYSILLDFDANQSIILKGNGEYQLKPVIRTVEVATTGSIRGSISPAGGAVPVTASANGVSYSSFANADGEFLVAGLPAGTYSVVITPELPQLPVTRSGIIVNVGVSTNMGMVSW
jgi:hypothetical protein